MSLAMRIYRQLRQPFKKRIERKIFFLHFPKCGGNSIKEAISECYDRSSTLLRNPAAHLDIKALYEVSQLSGKDVSSYLEQLLLYFMATKRIMFICGHFEFSETALHKLGAEWDYITILRHPVSRWFSHYFFNRYKADDHFKIYDDLPCFIDSDRGSSLGHLYIKALTGSAYESLSSTKEAVAAAIANLEQFTLVGCLEHLDTFASQFEKLYQVKLNVGKKNKNPLPKPVQEQQITDDIRRQVEKICEPDLEVYNYALSRLSNQRLI